MQYNLYDLSRIPLSGHELSIIAEDAWTAAISPDANLKHCPWDKARARASKYKRVVWRTVFRKTFEHKRQLAAELNGMAGMEIAA